MAKSTKPLSVGGVTVTIHPRKILWDRFSWHCHDCGIDGPLRRSDVNVMICALWHTAVHLQRRLK